MILFQTQDMKTIETAANFIRRKEQQFRCELEKKKPVMMKDIGRKGRHAFIRKAWTFMPQYNLSEKVFMIERLEKSGIEGSIVHKQTHRTGEVEYRIGYFIVGKIGFLRGRWAWGQFCPIIPAKDLHKLLAKARKDGTLKE